MIKLAGHVQDGSDRSRDHLRVALYPAVKCMGSCTARWFLEQVLPAYHAAGKPKPFIWWRSWTDDLRDYYVSQGAAGARSFVDRVMPELEPWRQLLGVRITESINEFNPQSPDDMKRLNEFEAESCMLFGAHGIGDIIGNFSVGWPDYPLWVHYRDALQRGEYLGKHEYGWPTLNAEGKDLRYFEHHVMRYRRDIQEIQRHGYRLPPVLMTEIGWDGALIGAGHRGFRTHSDQVEYLAWLQWYNGMIVPDDRVLFASMFQTGAQNDWREFDLIGSQIESVTSEWVRTSAWPGYPTQPPTAPPNIDLEAARAFKLRVNRKAALSQAIEAAGQWVGSDEFWHTGDSAYQWGVDYARGIWSLWRWDRGRPCVVVFTEPVR